MKHKAVLINETLHFLQIKKDEWYIDATLGGGNIAKAILEREAKVIGIDYDQVSLNNVVATMHSENNANCFRPVLGNFRDIKLLASQVGLNQVAGIVVDLGISSDQLEDPAYGLTFQTDSPLDMRVATEGLVKAEDLVNGLSPKELRSLLEKLGEVERPNLVTRAIVEYRKTKKITRTKELADIIRRAYGTLWKRQIHPATQVFMALRMAVNSELDNLRCGLPQMVDLLKPGGRLVIITFHSLEGRVVKNFLKGNSGVKVVNKKPILPLKEEVMTNSRARSAKMRVAEKI